MLARAGLLWLVTAASVSYGVCTAGPAQATIVVAEPDNFADGTDLTDAFAGVTLSVVPANVVGKPPTKVITVEGATAVGTRTTNPATTGVRVFGQAPQPVAGVQKFNEDRFGLLRADFAVATDYVQIDMIFDDDDVGILRAFDASGILLGSVKVSGDGRGPVPFVTGIISRISPDIAFITVGGFGSEGDVLDNLQFDLLDAAAVPEPSSLVMLCVALAGLAGVRSGRAWLADVLQRINDHPASRLDELLPWNWKVRPAKLAA